MQLRNALETLRTRLTPRLEPLDDTITAVSADAFQAALDAYHYARKNGEGAGIDELVEIMGKRFAHPKRTPPAERT